MTNRPQARTAPAGSPNHSPRHGAADNQLTQTGALRLTTPTED
jgi:hypothetical protein